MILVDVAVSDGGICATLKVLSAETDSLDDGKGKFTPSWYGGKTVSLISCTYGFEFETSPVINAPPTSFILKVTELVLGVEIYIYSPFQGPELKP